MVLSSTKYCERAWFVWRGKLIGLSACVFGTLMAAIIQITPVPPLITFFYRCVLVTPLLLCLVVFTEGKDAFSQLRKCWKPLLLRTILEAVSGCLSYCSVQYFSLTILGFISQTKPVFTMLGALVILGEKPSKFQVVCAFGAISGALLVIQPRSLGFPPAREEVLLGNESDSIKHTSSTSSARSRLYIGVIVVTLSRVFSACATCFMKLIASSGQVSWSLVALLQSSCGIVISVPALVILESVPFLWKVCAFKSKLQLIVLSCLSIGLQSSFFFCLKYEKSSMLSILETTSVVLMPIAELCLYGSLPPLNTFHFLGFVLTMASILSLFIAKHISSSRQ